MSFDVLIRGAVVVGDGGRGRVDVGVSEGLIESVGPELAGSAAEEIDATGLCLLPGVIDAHVHMNEPGRTDWEGFETGTRALAAGGATAAIDMPLNAHPPTVTAAAFEEKRRCLERNAVVDVALWGGLVPDSVEAMDELAACGVVGFKAFMCSSGIDDFPGVDDLILYEGMCRAASVGLPVAVHAESEAITAGLAQRARATGRTAMRDFLASRPAIAEVQAIARAIALAEESGCALHVVHVSTGRGVALVAAARARGVDASCETCPHYLVLTEEDAESLGNVAKCAPPLRAPEEREALWAALADGTLPMVASDHSPAPWAMKSGDDAFAAWGGISGCQTLLPLLLSEGYRARGLSLELIARVTSAYVARRFRLSGKGRLGPGADADLVLVNLEGSDVLSTDDLHYRHPHSPFVGRTLSARVARTIVRGRTVFADGRFVGPPAGRLLIPATRKESQLQPCRSPPARTASAPASRRSTRPRLARRSRSCCRSSRRSSTSAGAVSRPGSRLATSTSAWASRTTRATRRPARSSCTRAASARPRSSCPMAAAGSRASSASSPATTS
jgi:allantoinase